LDTLNVQLSTLPAGTPPTSLANRVQTSRNTFSKLLRDHSAKKPREKVQDLVRRVEKHYLEGDEQNLARELVTKVLARCEDRYWGVLERCRELGDTVYGGEVDGIEGLGSRDEVGRWFKGAR